MESLTITTTKLWYLCINCHIILSHFHLSFLFRFLSFKNIGFFCIWHVLNFIKLTYIYKLHIYIYNKILYYSIYERQNGILVIKFTFLPSLSVCLLNRHLAVYQSRQSSSLSPSLFSPYFTPSLPSLYISLICNVYIKYCCILFYLRRVKYN